MIYVRESLSIARDVRTITPPEIPIAWRSDEAYMMKGHVKRQNLGSLAVIANRMYGLLPTKERDEVTEKIITDVYGSWMIAASVLDDCIDDESVSAKDKAGQLRLGQRAFLGGEFSELDSLRRPANISLQIFAHAGQLLLEHSCGKSEKLLEPYMTKLTDALGRQHASQDVEEQTEIAETVGGTCIAAPLIFAHSIRPEASYSREISAAFALGGWAQKLDNVRDMAYDNASGQITHEVLRLRSGEKVREIAVSAVKEAYRKFTADVSGAPIDQKRVLYAMAHMIFAGYMILNPARTFLRYGKLSALAPPKLREDLA